MKRNILMAFLVSALIWQMATAQESYTKDATKLPVAAREFIEKHFSKEKIAYILIDKEILTTDYEVILENGQEIKFDKEGVWKEMEGKKKALPASAIPTEVQAYIKANFPGVDIEQIEREHWGYEFELINGLEVKLDKKGNLLKIDD